MSGEIQKLIADRLYSNVLKTRRIDGNDSLETLANQYVTSFKKFSEAFSAIDDWEFSCAQWIPTEPTFDNQTTGDSFVQTGLPTNSSSSGQANIQSDWPATGQL